MSYLLTGDQLFCTLCVCSICISASFHVCEQFISGHNCQLTHLLAGDKLFCSFSVCVCTPFLLLFYSMYEQLNGQLSWWPVFGQQPVKMSFSRWLTICSLCVHVLHFVSVSLHVRVVHIQCCQDVLLSVSDLPFCSFSVCASVPYLFMTLCVSSLQWSWSMIAKMSWESGNTVSTSAAREELHLSGMLFH